MGKRYIDAEPLYERTAEWEASALSKIEELNRIPLEEMTDEERAEWRRWAAILGERTAFKHDVADAPTADVVERKKGKWIKSNESALRPYMCSECGALFDVDTVLGKLSWQYCPACGTEMEGEDDG